MDVYAGNGGVYDLFSAIGTEVSRWGHGKRNEVREEGREEPTEALGAKMLPCSGRNIMFIKPLWWQSKA